MGIIMSYILEKCQSFFSELIKVIPSPEIQEKVKLLEDRIENKNYLESILSFLEVSAYTLELLKELKVNINVNQNAILVQLAPGPNPTDTTKVDILTIKEEKKASLCPQKRLRTLTSPKPAYSHFKDLPMTLAISVAAHLEGPSIFLRYGIVNGHFVNIFAWATTLREEKVSWSIPKHYGQLKRTGKDNGGVTRKQFFNLLKYGPFADEISTVNLGILYGEDREEIKTFIKLAEK